MASVTPITDSSFNTVISQWISDPSANQFTVPSNNPYYGTIENWNVSNVTNMFYAFGPYTSFNDDISNWDTSNVTNMQQMFEYNTSFNQQIGNWDTSKVTNMNGHIFTPQLDQ